MNQSLSAKYKKPSHRSKSKRSQASVEKILDKMRFAMISKIAYKTYNHFDNLTFYIL